MLKNYIDFYSKKSIIITPIISNTKAPFLIDWQNKGYDEDLLIEEHGNKDFALVTGPLSNIMVLDLDLVDDKYKKLIIGMQSKEKIHALDVVTNAMEKIIDNTDNVDIAQIIMQYAALTLTIEQCIGELPI